jgi:hypothetical protein
MWVLGVIIDAKDSSWWPENLAPERCFADGKPESEPATKKELAEVLRILWEGAEADSRMEGEIKRAIDRLGPPEAKPSESIDFGMCSRCGTFHGSRQPCPTRKWTAERLAGWWRSTLEANVEGRTIRGAKDWQEPDGDYVRVPNDFDGDDAMVAEARRLMEKPAEDRKSVV